MTKITKKDVQGKLIPISEVPKGYTQHDWSMTFNIIPSGKALVLTLGKEIDTFSVFHALYHRHKKGQYLHLKCVKRGNNVYIVNSKRGDK